MSDLLENSFDKRKLAYDYYWKWFQYHAQQRYENFRLFVLQLFLTPAGILGVAYSKTDIFNVPAATFGVGLALITEAWLCFIFYRIDRRNETLVKMGEAGLRKFESHCVKIFDLPSILTPEEEDKSESDWFHSHSKLLEALFKTAIFIFFCSGIICIWLGAK